jgi:hypothetical protein
MIKLLHKLNEMLKQITATPLLQNAPTPNKPLGSGLSQTPP